MLHASCTLLAVQRHHSSCDAQYSDRKKEAIWSFWGTLVHWSTLCQMNRDCSAVCYCYSTSPQHHSYEAGSETLVQRNCLLPEWWTEKSVSLTLLFCISVSFSFRKKDCFFFFSLFHFPFPAYSEPLYFFFPRMDWREGVSGWWQCRRQLMCDNIDACRCLRCANARWHRGSLSRYPADGLRIAFPSANAHGSPAASQRAL